MTLHPVPAGGTGRSASEGASVQGAALQAEAAVPGTDVQAGAEQEGTAQEAAAQKAAALWYGDEVVAYREAADSLHTQRQAAGRSEAGSGEAGTQLHTAGAATVQTHRTNDATAAHRSGTTERQGHASGARHADEAQHTAGQHATQRSARQQHAAGSRAEHAGSKETATGQQSGHAAATDTARKQTERTAGTQQKSGSAAAQHTTGSQQAESAADARHNDAGYTATQHTADARHSAAVGSASPAAAGMRAETQTEAAAQLPDSLAAAMPDSLRMEADSLTGSLAGADTLWESPLGAFMPGDSLYAHATTLHYLPDGTPLEGYRTVGAGEFFGQQSLLAAPRPAAQQQPRLTDELPFQGLVLLLTLLFGLLLYRNPGDMRALVGRVAFERRDSERTSDESGNAGFTRFLNIALALGFLLAGVTAVRLCDRPDIAQELLSMGNGSTLSLLLALGVGLLFLLVYLYGILLLRAVGGVTLTSGFTTQLIRIKREVCFIHGQNIQPCVMNTDCGTEDGCLCHRVVPFHTGFL